MDVLTPIRRRAPWAWLAVLAWLSVAACLSLPSAGRVEPSFPHRVHVVDNQLACDFCHPGARVAEDPGTPPPELCAPCHDQFDAQKPPERRVGAFFDERSRYRKLAESGRTPDVRFSHAQHVRGARLDCEACHADVARQEEVPLRPLVVKAECMACHAEYGMANACAECHRDIDRNWLPPSHAGGWLRAHGDVVLLGSGASADQCSLCHQDATGCLACHQQMAPADHDQTCRGRTRGMRASVDRARCAVCHTQDSCEQCHQVTRPRSHRGGFGAPQNRHCGSCHFPLADSGCTICHPGAPSHDLAAPLPADHSPAMNCRLCHGNGVPLPHVDGGHVCTICHR